MKKSSVVVLIVIAFGLGFVLAARTSQTTSQISSVIDEQLAYHLLSTQREAVVLKLMSQGKNDEAKWLVASSLKGFISAAPRYADIPLTARTRSMVTQVVDEAKLATAEYDKLGQEGPKQ